MKTLTTAIFSFYLIFNFMFSGCGNNEDTSSKKEETSSKKEDKTSKIGEIWSQIEKKNEALGVVVRSGKATHLDDQIADVMNLVKTLPARSTGLETSRIDAIKSKISEMEKIGKSMDQFQHDKNVSEVSKEYEKFKQGLAEIKNQYPPDSFN